MPMLSCATSYFSVDFELNADPKSNRLDTEGADRVQDMRHILLFAPRGSAAALLVGGTSILWLQDFLSSLSVSEGVCACQAPRCLLPPSLLHNSRRKNRVARPRQWGLLLDAITALSFVSSSPRPPGGSLRIFGRTERSSLVQTCMPAIMVHPQPLPQPIQAARTGSIRSV